MFFLSKNPPKKPTGIFPVSLDDWKGLPKDVRKAFKIFQKWWSKQKRPKKSDMPPNVTVAYEFIKSAKLPSLSLNIIKNSYIKSIEQEFKKTTSD